ncbi:unnamed protein product [Nezara viridula]|uniref:Uncharacterized protein n=1 Tax=Nezara viridula TaxID=85310 RepID=A0A9P0MX06_NEZVI|nr:unnamed protein product [Nezara viridula]
MCHELVQHTNSSLQSAEKTKVIDLQCPHRSKLALNRVEETLKRALEGEDHVYIKVSLFLKLETLQSVEHPAVWLSFIPCVIPSRNIYPS